MGLAYVVGVVATLGLAGVARVVGPLGSAGVARVVCPWVWLVLPGGCGP